VSVNSTVSVTLSPGAIVVPSDRDVVAVKAPPVGGLGSSWTTIANCSAGRPCRSGSRRCLLRHSAAARAPRRERCVRRISDDRRVPDARRRLGRPYDAQAVPLRARELVDPSSNLIVNGERILAAEFRSEAQAREVLEAIGKGERRFEEIRRRVSLQPASLSRSLELLVRGKGVVERLTPCAAPLPRGDPRYLIADPYLRFWLRFVAPRMQEIERGRGDAPRRRVSLRVRRILFTA